MLCTCKWQDFGCTGTPSNPDYNANLSGASLYDTENCIYGK